MMIQRFTVAVFLMLAFSAQADIILGMDVSGHKIACAYKKKIRISSLLDSAFRLESEPSKDSALCGKIHRKVNSILGFFAKDNAPVKAVSVNDFNIVNLSYRGDKLYAGIRFYSGEAKSSRIIYGMLELDSSLNILNYYIFKTPASVTFTLLPYYPLEFISDTQLALPCIDSGKLALFSFQFIPESHEIRKQFRLKKDIQISKMRQVLFPQNILMDPMVYSIRNSKYDLYYRFAFPVVFSDKGSVLFNAYHFKERSAMSQSPRAVDGMFLYFEQQYKLDTMIVYGSCYYKDTVCLLVGSPNRNYLMYARIHVTSGVFSPGNIKIEFEDTYMYLQEHRLIAVKRKDENLKIQTIKF